MISSFSCMLLQCTAVCIALPVFVQAQGPGVTFDLQELVAKLKSEHPGVKMGIQVAEIEGGKPIFGDGADDMLVPASVLKLLTTYAALKYLGAGYKFPTEVFVDHLPKEISAPGRQPAPDFSEPPASVGNLYIRGYGDPGMDLSHLRALTDALPRFGIKSVRDVVIDDSLFINPPRASGEKPHEAGLSAVTINSNTYTVNIAPGPLGQDAVVTISEPVPYELRNKVKTVRGTAFELTISQTPGSALSLPGAEDPLREFFRLKRSYAVTVQGAMGLSATPQSFLRAAPDLPEYYALLLRDCLVRSGVAVDGKFLRGEIPREAKSVEIVESDELTQLVREINHFSSNVMAGQLGFALGQDQNGYFRFDRGLDRLRNTLVQLGEKEDSFVLVDGSGLDRGNRIKASQLVHILLSAAQDFSIEPDFVASLSRFGQSGTLKTRELLEPAYIESLWGDEREEAKRRAAAVWAKTGTLDGVSSLAGYASLKSGEKVAFAILLNDVGEKDRATKIEDDVVKTLLGFPHDFVPSPVIPKGIVREQTGGKGTSTPVPGESRPISPESSPALSQAPALSQEGAAVAPPRENP